MENDHFLVRQSTRNRTVLEMQTPCWIEGPMAHAGAAGAAGQA